MYFWEPNEIADNRQAASFKQTNLIKISVIQNQQFQTYQIHLFLVFLLLIHCMKKLNRLKSSSMFNISSCHNLQMKY